MTVPQDYYFTNKATAFFSINNHVIFIFCQSRMNSINIRLLIKNNNELKINWGHGLQVAIVTDASEVALIILS